MGQHFVSPQTGSDMAMAWLPWESRGTGMAHTAGSIPTQTTTGCEGWPHARPLNASPRTSWWVTFGGLPGSRFSVALSSVGFPKVGKWPVFWASQSDLLHHLSLRQGTHVLHVTTQTHLAQWLFRMKLCIPCRWGVSRSHRPVAGDGQTLSRQKPICPICLAGPLLSWRGVCGLLDANQEIFLWKCTWSGVWCAKFNLKFPVGDCLDKECAALSWLLRGHFELAAWWFGFIPLPSKRVDLLTP